MKFSKSRDNNFVNTLCKYLIENNWKQEKYNKKNIYDYCDITNNSKIDNIDLSTYKYWQNKFFLYSLLENKKYIPETYIIFNGKYLTEEPQTDNKLYFIKNSIADANRDNYLTKDLNEIIKISQQNSKKMYIVQPSINSLTYKNKKFDIRIWGCLISHDHISFELLVFKKGRVRLSRDNYDFNSSNNYSQFTCIGSNDTKIDFNENFTNYRFFMKKIIPIIQSIFNKSKLHFVNQDKLDQKLVWIVGFDFIFDNNRNIYLLEINNKPSFFNMSVASEEFIKYLAENIYTPMAKNEQPIYNDQVIKIT